MRKAWKVLNYLTATLLTVSAKCRQLATKTRLACAVLNTRRARSRVLRRGGSAVGICVRRCLNGRRAHDELQRRSIFRTTQMRMQKHAGLANYNKRQADNADIKSVCSKVLLRHEVTKRGQRECRPQESPEYHATPAETPDTCIRIDNRQTI